MPLDITKTAIVVSIVAASSVAQAPISDLFGSLIDYQGNNPSAYLRLAPIVLLATVVSNETTGPPARSRWAPDTLVQPHLVECKLEQLVRIDRGPRPNENFKFVYFAEALPEAYNPYTKLYFQAKPGARYLFSLIRQGDSLRSIGDVGEYSIPIYSGAHPPQPNDSYDPTPEKLIAASFTNRVAEIMLVLRSGADLDKYAEQLSAYQSTASLLGWSKILSFDVLHELLSSVPSVRAAACFELNLRFHGQYTCLEKLKIDVEQSPRVQSHASQRLEQVMRLESLMFDSLKDPAKIGDYEDLRILSMHPSKPYRQLACAALLRYFPYRDAPGCPGR